MDTKINVYILSIIFKLHTVLIILTVVSAPSILSTWRNSTLKSMICENHVENVPPYWYIDVIMLANKHHEY